MPRSSLRLNSALLAAASTSVTAGSITFLAPQLGPLSAAGVALAGAALTGSVVWAGLTPLARLAVAAKEVTAGRRDPTALSAGSSELLALTEAVHAIEDRRVQLGEAATGDVVAIAEALAQLADSKATLTPPKLQAVNMATSAAFNTGFEAAVKELSVTRQRWAWAARVLAHLPDAVVATDGAGIPRYLNPLAEQLFEVSTAAASRASITALFADVGQPEPTGDDPAISMLGAAEIGDWLRGGAKGVVLARTVSGKPIELAALVSGKSSRDRIVCLMARDAAPMLNRIAADRMAVRAAATRRFLERYLDESANALEQIGAQLRLLTGEAKQSGHRDAMLSKLSTAGHGLRRLETFYTLSDQFLALVWGEGAEPTPSEFMPAEVANLVVDKLASRMKSRGNAVKVVDQGGWMYADADRLEAALMGLLVHAGDAAANTQLELRITRQPAGPDRPHPLVEFHLLDAGPALTADQLAVVDHPFGGLAPAPLGRFEGAEGFPLGLVVASRLAQALSGDLVLENGAAGQLSARLVVPSLRAADMAPAVIAVAAPGALDVAPAEETVAGWRLGMPTPQVTA